MNHLAKTALVCVAVIFLTYRIQFLRSIIIGA